MFDGARPHLQNCLLGQTERPQKQSAWWLAALAVVLVVLVAIGFFAIRRNTRWNQFLAKLQSQPGIVVTDSQKNWGHYAVTGMRDPLAADPAQLASEFGIAPHSLEAHFEPYQSLDPRFSRPRRV